VRQSSFISAIVTELLHPSQEALWAIALLPTAFGKSTADGASGIQMERAGLRPSLSPYLYFIQLTIAVFVVEQAREACDRTLVLCSRAIAPSDFVKLLRLGSGEENAVCPANETLSTALDLRSGWHRNQPLGGRNASPRHLKIYVLRSENSAPKQFMERSSKYPW